MTEPHSSKQVSHQPLNYVIFEKISTFISVMPITTNLRRALNLHVIRKLLNYVILENLYISTRIRLQNTAGNTKYKNFCKWKFFFLLLLSKLLDLCQ